MVLNSSPPSSQEVKLLVASSPSSNGNQSILSQKQINNKVKADPLSAIDKDFKNGWFKKNAGFLVDSIEHLLSDSSFSLNTVRLTILLLANINALCKAQG